MTKPKKRAMTKTIALAESLGWIEVHYSLINMCVVGIPPGRKYAKPFPLKKGKSK